MAAVESVEAQDPRVTAALGALREVFGDELVSVMLVGAAADPSRPDRHRHPELLAVTKRAHTADLTQLASGIAVPLKRGLRLRLVTEQELSDSADSFALEAAELRDRHLLVAGSDVASAIQVDREHLRLDCERRLRGLTRQLRNRALQGLSRHEGEEVLRVVRDTVHALVIVAHHALGLQAPKESLPADRLSLLRALCDAADVPAAALVDWVSQLDAGRATDPLAGLDVLLPVLESTSHWVDGLGT